MHSELGDDYLSDEEKAYFEKGGSDDVASAIEKKYNEGGEVNGDDTEREGGVDTEAQDSETAGSGDEAASEPESENVPDTDKDVGRDDADTDDSDVSNQGEDKSPRDYEKAFKAELHKRKELKEAFEVNARKTQELESALNELRKQSDGRIAAETKTKEVVPDPTDDPLGYQQYRIDKLQETIVNQSKYLQSQYQAQQRSQGEAAFRQVYSQHATEYAKENPDFFDAYKYAIEARTKQYLAAGYNQAQANELVEEDEKAIAAKALTDKANPAERVYAFAVANGYSKAKTTNGKSSDKGKIASIKDNMSKSRSLKSGGGEHPDKELGLNDVDSMDFNEFDIFWNKMKKRAK